MNQSFLKRISQQALLGAGLVALCGTATVARGQDAAAGAAG